MPMIFAELTQRLSVNEILEVLERRFGSVEWGDQGAYESPDAYFWIKRKDEKVSVDNLTSLNFQVKSAQRETALVKEVIDVLADSFAINVYEKPEIEAHE